MKSSTIRRSNLSKEKMAVLEALSNYKSTYYDNSPNVYVRPNKEKELDLLWQNFKINQKNDKSPNIYLAAGFITGAVVMLLLVVMISFSAKGINSFTEKLSSVPTPAEKLSLNFIPASSEKTEEQNVANEQYTVQSGDTMEAILVRFYGSYSKEKESLVLKTNNMTNPNKLSIGQKLIIPMEEQTQEY